MPPVHPYYEIYENKSQKIPSYFGLTNILLAYNSTELKTVATSLVAATQCNPLTAEGSTHGRKPLKRGH